jgi:hypothetical protein
MAKVGVITGTQIELFKQRGRKRPAPRFDPSELQIQISLVTRLRLMCKPGIVWWHCPNGEERDKRVAAKLKAMGVLPGVSDLTFVFAKPRPNLFLELKARGKGLTDAQEIFRDRVRANGHIYEWTDSIDDAVRILIKHNVL